MRIVSLLPSATEILCGLGLRESLVGVSHECDYPSSVMSLPRVTRTLITGGTSGREIDEQVREAARTQQALYALNLEVLQQLKPDLIVGQTLCGVCAVPESEVARAVGTLVDRPPVINLEPTCLEDVLESMLYLGRATGREQSAQEYVNSLRARAEALAKRTQSLQDRPSVMLMEWIDPPFTAGHWNPEIVSLAGGHEVLGLPGKPSETVAWNRIVQADPQVMVIACCGFTVPQSLQELCRLKDYDGWSDLQCVRNQRVYVVDGSAYFSRPGPRLIDSLEILAHTLHPEWSPLPAHLPAALNAIESAL